MKVLFIVNDTGIKAEVISEIRTLAEKNGINRVILFGSRARGDYTRTSDIDLAVSSGDAVGFSLDVEENTSTLLFYNVVDLDKQPQQALIDSIERDGIVIYEKA